MIIKSSEAKKHEDIQKKIDTENIIKKSQIKDEKNQELFLLMLII